MTAGTPSAATPLPELSEGCIVKVVGLVKAQTLNGRYGMVRRADPQRPGRFQVDFEGTEEGKELVTATIRRENLALQDGEEEDSDDEEEQQQSEAEAGGEAAAEASAAEERPLQVGDTVRVGGLASAAARHLNGQLGRLSSFNGESGRWHVRLIGEGTGTKAFKPDNLTRVPDASDGSVQAPPTAAAPAAEAPPAPAAPASADAAPAALGAGATVKIQGLASAAVQHLNGQTGTVVSLDQKSGRWHVRLAGGGGTKAFKEANLLVEAPTAPPAATAAAPGEPGAAGGSLVGQDYGSDEEQQSEEAAADAAAAAAEGEEGAAVGEWEEQAEGHEGAYQGAGVEEEEEELEEDEEELEDEWEGDGLQAGAQVRIQGLVSAAARHLNDLVGTLSLFDPSNGRWQVRLEGGDVKAFKPENLALEAPAAEIAEEADEALGLDTGEIGGDDDLAHLDSNELAAAALQAELTEDTEQLAKLNAAIERRKEMGEAYSSGTSGSSRKIEISVDVPAVAVGFVIGRGGERIKDLSAECGVRMRFDREVGESASTRTLFVHGSESGVEKARAMIQEAIDEGVAIYKGGGKGKGKGKDKGKGKRQGATYRTASDRVGEGAAGFEEGICKWYAAGFCRNRAHNGACRNGLHSSEAAIKAEQDWVSQGPPVGTAGPLKNLNQPLLLLLDLEGGGNRDGTDGEDEIIEVPVLAMDPTTGREMGRFHRFARPGFWDRNVMDMRSRFAPQCFNERTSSVPFPQVVSEMQTFISTVLGIDSPAKLKGDSFLFVTCGNWDVKTAIPLQCNKPVPGAVDVPTQKLLFSKWSNLKDVFREHYKLPQDRAPTGMRGMLNRLRIPLSGQHHLGMDDVTNLAKILSRLIKEDCKLEPTGFAKNLDVPPPMFGGGKGKKGKGKGKGKGGDFGCFGGGMGGGGMGGCCMGGCGMGGCGMGGCGMGGCGMGGCGMGGGGMGGGFGKDSGGKGKGQFGPCFGGKGKLFNAFGAGGGGFGGGGGSFGGGSMGSFVKAGSPAAGAAPKAFGIPHGAQPKASAKRPAPPGGKEEEDEDDYDPFAEEPAAHVSQGGAAGAKQRRGLGKFLRGAPMPGQTWDSDADEDDKAGGSMLGRGLRRAVPPWHLGGLGGSGPDAAPGASFASTPVTSAPAGGGGSGASGVEEYGEEGNPFAAADDEAPSGPVFRPRNKPPPWQLPRQLGRGAASFAGGLAGIFDPDGGSPAATDAAPSPPSAAAAAAEEEVEQLRGAGAGDEPRAKAPRLSNLFASLPAPRAAAGR